YFSSTIITSLIFFLMIPPPPTSTLFPYTTLFRSHLGKGWAGFNFGRALGKPVRVINDAAMQALGSYHGGGRMLFLGLGTGLEKQDRKSTRLNSSHVAISYAVFCLKKKK